MDKRQTQGVEYATSKIYSELNTNINNTSTIKCWVKLYAVSHDRKTSFLSVFADEHSIRTNTAIEKNTFKSRLATNTGGV